MNVIVVDDEKIILDAEGMMIKRMMSEANVSMFSNYEDAIEYALNNTLDIAFLDINMEACNGLELAKKLKNFNPKINIIFCTGYSEYSLDALSLYCSGYLMKPVTEEKIKGALNNLRYSVNDKKELLSVTCFGEFDLTYHDKPVLFKYAKTKEMFAYLIDRKGEACGINEIMMAIMNEDNKQSYIRNLKADLIHSFEVLGIEDILVYPRGKIGIKQELVNCDYYDFLKGNKELFHGEYMKQYAFAKKTLETIN